MYPVICKIGPFTVYSYGLMLAIAFMVSLYLINRKAKDAGLDSQKIYNFAFIVLLFGILGARTLYVILHFVYYIDTPAEVIMLHRGGLSWFGALFFGIAAAVIYIKKKGLSPFKTLDLIIPFVALGQAIGRIGCLLNGCCYGRPSAFGLYFNIHNAVLIPTQIYSSLSLLAIFLILRKIQDSTHQDGEVFFIYLILYSIMRFLIEFWRAEHEIVAFGLTVFQMISLIIFFLSIWGFVNIKIKRSK